MEESKRKKVVNYLLCALLGIAFGIACSLCIIICANGLFETRKLILTLIGVFALLWGVYLPEACRRRVKDALKTFGISLVILIISGILYYNSGIINQMTDASISLTLLMIPTMLIPMIVATIFSSKSNKKARNESPEMQLSKRVADWYSKYLIESGIDEKTVSNFKKCLINILYKHSIYKSSYILATGYGELQCLENDFKLPKGVFPEDLVMCILYKDNKAYYNYMLSSPGIEII